MAALAIPRTACRRRGAVENAVGVEASHHDCLRSNLPELGDGAVKRIADLLFHCVSWNTRSRRSGGSRGSAGGERTRGGERGGGGEKAGEARGAEIGAR